MEEQLPLWSDEELDELAAEIPPKTSTEEEEDFAEVSDDFTLTEEDDEEDEDDDTEDEDEDEEKGDA